MSVALIVACTKRKTERIPDKMFFHTLPRTYGGALASLWLDRADREEKVPAFELYAGGNWVNSARIAEATGADETFVVSAGFGLLGEGDLLPPYSATFGPGEDQVSHKIEGRGSFVDLQQHWWKCINGVRGLGVTPLTDTLMNCDKILCNLSIPYIKAVQQDLVFLAEAVGPEKLYIICAGAATVELGDGLKPYILPFDSKMRRHVQGSIVGINHHLTKWLLSDIVPKVGWDRSALSQALNNLSVGTSKEPTQLSMGDLFTPDPSEPKKRGRPAYTGTAITSPNIKLEGVGTPGKRLRYSDEDVMKWIREFLAKNKAAPKGLILSTFRKTGMSCNQVRFMGLIAEVRSEGETEDAGSTQVEPTTN